MQRRNAALILLLELGTSQRMGLSRSALKVQWSWWLNHSQPELEEKCSITAEAWDLGWLTTVGPCQF